MTASGWLNLNNNECDERISGDLNQNIYFHVDEWNYSTIDSYGCIDSTYAFETVWDGDSSNPYYKDLDMSNPHFDSCEDLGSRYSRVPFRKVPNSHNWDHCVVAFGANGRFDSECWDD